MRGIFCTILLVPHNIILDVNNVYVSLSRLFLAPAKPFNCASCMYLGGASDCGRHLIGLWMGAKSNLEACA